MNRKELKIINKAAFSDLRGYLLKVLLSDEKIGKEPTIEVKREEDKKKIPCLRCGFLFFGSKHKRICYTCRQYNRGLDA